MADFLSDLSAAYRQDNGGEAPPSSDFLGQLSAAQQQDAANLGAPPKHGFGEALTYGIANSVPFAQDIGAAIQAGESYLPSRLQVDQGIPDLTGRSFGERFGEERARIGKNQAEIQSEYPITSTVAPIAGAAATLPVAGPVEGVTAAASRVLPDALASVVGAGTVGAGYGALYGAGAGDTLSDRASNAAVGAGLGAVGGVLAPALAGGISRIGGAAANLAKGIITPEAAGADAAIRAIAADRAAGAGTLLTDADIAAAQQRGQPIVGADLGGQSTRRLARAVANKSPEAQAALTAPLSDRFSDQADRFNNFLSGMYGGNIDAVAARDALQSQAKAANSPAYRQAYADGANGVWTPGLESLVNSPNVQNAIRGATQVAANDAVLNGTPVVRNPFVSDATGNLSLKADPQGNRTIPALQFWDYVKRGLDDQIGAAFSSGEKAKGAQLSALKNQLLGELDAAVPSYANARQGAFQMFGAENALDAGANVLKPSVDATTLQKAINKMTPQQQSVFSYGAATALASKALNSGDNRNIVNLFNTPAIRDKLQIAMGPQRFGQIESFMRVESAMNALKQAVGGNSTTAQQAHDLIGLATQHLSGPIAGAAAGAAEAAREEGGFDPVRMAKYAAVGALGGMMLKAYTGQNHALMESIARNLASDDPAIHNAAIRRISQDKNAMQALRSVSNRLTAAQAGATPQEPGFYGSVEENYGPPPFKRGGAVNHNPTEAQKEAGNYKKRHIRIYGLEISIENEKGSYRYGTANDGRSWSVKMPAAYGYLRKTLGADGDHVDCYVGPDENAKRVFVVDQRDLRTKRFDEHKALLGFRSQDEAARTYRAGFSDGKGGARMMKITPMSVEQFKEWLKYGDTTSPIKKAA